ncbi:hypothetical protein AGLY_002524 [Aphis glycines]|uniref:Uncharacterized protein n=1 Tax=Aphis glycines TaxID=307491 RepID=A0A6G0U0Z8_APHGL|nr:hypothetical protein AGLY_002524 [Aphis glycines]
MDFPKKLKRDMLTINSISNNHQTSWLNRTPNIHLMINSMVPCSADSLNSPSDALIETKIFILYFKYTPFEPDVHVVYLESNCTSRPSGETNVLLVLSYALPQPPIQLAVTHQTFNGINEGQNSDIFKIVKILFPETYILYGSTKGAITNKYQNFRWVKHNISDLPNFEQPTVLILTECK